MKSRKILWIFCFVVVVGILGITIANHVEGDKSAENTTFYADSELPKHLCHLKVQHYGFDKKKHDGQLIVNCEIKNDIKEIFEELLVAKYPIEKVKLISHYNNNDDLSMEDNNTSAYNYRQNVTTPTELSKHAYGLGIDINPKYNPYIKGEIVKPNNAENLNREKPCDYCIKKDDIIYNAFIKRGFIWGGDWESRKDYQHFEKDM